MFPTDLLRFRIRTKSETVSQSALISVYVGTFKRVCVCVCRWCVSLVRCWSLRILDFIIVFTEADYSSQGAAFCPAHGDWRSRLRSVSSRLNLYTLDCLLIVGQIAALKPNTVRAAWKGLTGISWINKWDPAQRGSWLVFNYHQPCAQYWTVPGRL